MSVLPLDRPRQAKDQRPASAITFDVARDLDALMRVFALRAVVFSGEQNCPHDEEFDGNDLTATTHILAEIDGEPVATMRLRWFADFVKVERVLVKHQHRGADSLIASRLLDFGLELARRRGYRRALAYAQVRLKGFWRRMGFRLRHTRKSFVFSDHEYAEFERTLAPHPTPLSMDCEPLVLMRPDGAWDQPGVLDRSATRPASNPHR